MISRRRNRQVLSRSSLLNYRPMTRVETSMADDNNHLQDLVAEVAAAYFSNTHVRVEEIPQVISQIAASLSTVGASSAVMQAEQVPDPAEQEPATKRLTPAQVRKSVTPDALISFEDGKGYKTLRRHLSTKGL